MTEVKHTCGNELYSTGRNSPKGFGISFCPSCERFMEVIPMYGWYDSHPRRYQFNRLTESNEADFNIQFKDDIEQVAYRSKW
jgi:hypothetical protein